MQKGNIPFVDKTRTYDAAVAVVIESLNFVENCTRKVLAN